MSVAKRHFERGKTVSIRILSVGSCVPERILTNFDLEKMVDTSDEWIRSRTGIETRHLSAPGQASSDLATLAAQKALDSAETGARDLDAILVATVTPDHAFPSTACLVQRNLGAERAFGFDMAAACSGLIYALHTGYCLMKTMPETYRKIMIIGVEQPTKLVDWTNRNTCVLFGDGASAVLLGNDPAGTEDFLVSSALHTDGRLGDLLKLPAGGSRMPASEETVAQKLHCLRMDGRETFKNAVANMVSSSKEALEKAHLTVNGLRWVIPHQANIRIMDAVAQRLGAAPEQVYSNIARIGNTSAASIGICLDEIAGRKLVNRGDLLLLTAFGGGLTWGGMVIRW